LILLVFSLAFVAALVVTVFAIATRPMTRLAKIQVVLTVLAGIAFVADMRMALWLHSMAYANPVRRLWQPRLEVVSSFVWESTLIPWLLFSILHGIVVVKRKLMAKAVAE